MTDNNPADGTDREQPTEPGSLTYPMADDESPSDAVVRAVASFTDEGILDIDPLYHVIEPE